MLVPTPDGIRCSTYAKDGLTSDAVRPIGGVPFFEFLTVAGNPALSVDGDPTPVDAEHEFAEDCEIDEIRVAVYSSGTTPWADEEKLVGLVTGEGKGFKLSVVDGDDADVAVFTPIVVVNQAIWAVYGTTQLAGPQASTKAGSFVLKFDNPRRVRAGWKVRLRISFDATTFAFFGCSVAGSI